MASNPWAILQSARESAPDLGALYSGLKQQRLVDLYNAKKMQREDSQFEKEHRRDELMARLFTKGSPSETAPTTAPPAAAVDAPVPVDASVPSGSPLVSSPVPTAPVQAPTITAPAAAGGVNRDVLDQLTALDPETGFKLMDHFSKQSETDRKAAKDKYDILGSAAMHLTSYPPDQRKAALQQLAPRLMAAGWTPEELNQADLSDAGLQGYSAVAMDVDKIIAARRADAQFASTEADRAERLRLAKSADARAAAARSEGHVRFTERDKDRAAIAASGGGIRTDTADLDY